jgi:4-hydroxythreonine-4-phosphate dehydrogenase
MPPSSQRRLNPLAVTMGDPAGIGPDIICLSWLARADRGLMPFAVYGDPSVLAARARAIGAQVSVQSIESPAEAADVFARALPVVSVPAQTAVAAGQPSPVNAASVITAIEQAVAATHRGDTSAVVTCPIAKSVLYASGFHHPGHTEFLAHLADTLVPGRQHTPVMMLASAELRVVPLTIHIPLASVPAALSRKLIFETVRTTWAALRSDFGIAQPRIAVAGLNPHAGESGTIGREEVELIAPTIESLRAEGLAVSGPHSADTMFHAAARRTYDAAICMYHDQALIPIKTLAFDTGVNVTLGLPFVRTSPDHGTAFDIAGTGRASPESLIASLQMAQDIATRREAVSRKAQ